MLLARFIRFFALALALVLIGGSMFASSASAVSRGTLSIADASLMEGDSGLTALAFTVSLAPNYGPQVTVDYTVKGLTATEGTDFSKTSGQLVFKANDEDEYDARPPSLILVVPIRGDLLDEDDELLSVTLSNPTNATISDGEAIGIINDNDPLPVVSLTGGSGQETNAPTTATFTASISGPSGRTVRVRYSTKAGTASTADFSSASAEVFIAEGETSVSFEVSIAGDLSDEPDESFSVRLSDPINATIGTAQADWAIIDDDAPPSLRTSDATVIEGDLGTSEAKFVVSVSEPSGWAISFSYATRPISALEDVDYIASSGTIQLAPGTAKKDLVVKIAGDLQSEGDETFEIVLFDPVNVVLENTSATAVIVDNDDAPGLVVGDVAVIESDSPRVPADPRIEGFENESRTFPTSSPGLLGSFGGDWTANCQPPTIGCWQRTQTQARSGKFSLLGVGSVIAPNSVALKITYPPDSTNRKLSFFYKFDRGGGGSLNIRVNGQGRSISNNSGGWTELSFTSGLVPGDNTLIVQVLGPTAQAGLDDIVQSFDVPGPPAVAGEVSLKVNLTQVAANPVNVSFQTVAGTATADVDYVHVAGNLSFLPGETEKRVAVPMMGDSVDEFDESFTLQLSEALGAKLADPQGVATILDNDLPPALAVNDVVVTEGGTATFEVKASEPSAKPMSVSYKTTDGSAVAGEDFTPADGFMAFSEGEVSKIVEVQVTADSIGELDEQFFLDLSNPTNAGIVYGRGVATVLNDDPALRLTTGSIPFFGQSVGRYFLDEGDGPLNKAMLFDVYLTPPSPEDVIVDFSTRDLTAREGEDYFKSSGRLTIPAGQTHTVISVPLNGDLVVEADESFEVILSSSVGADIADGSDVGNIRDDDPNHIFMEAFPATEGLPAGVWFSIDRPSDLGVSVDYSVEGCRGCIYPATAGVDYAPQKGKMVWLPSEAGSKQAPIPTYPDAFCEGSEIFEVWSSNPLHAVVTIDRVSIDIHDPFGPPLCGI